ncbi:sugar phosphate isomerase/epimerase [Paenibacillus sp. ISL-20]|uniref:sugar phosphate isomerase/epimerase family protein n=1 Tax=Paenibacillus sp. ISL-20 TaxID=2819163 RepID=UPI001BE6534D|nr:sugar phosphate isomerase/epimerase [Paenibacillus sp. ISL-20]MBT2764687.1 sugar phosphate isomerase/epimerase [Paenibacillus sp. ISL-20]
MRLGIFSKTFERPTLEENLDAVKATGLSVIQFNLSCAGLSSLPDVIDLETAVHIREECEKRHLHIAAVSGTFNMIHPDRQRLRDDIRRFRQLAAMCHSMGTSVITLCTGTRDKDNMWRAHPDNESSEAWDDLLATMRELVNMAEEFELELAIEPEPANVISDAVKARRLLDTMGSPRLKVVLDAANLFSPTERRPLTEVIDQVLSLLSEHVIMAHAKDYSTVDGLQYKAAGTGELDYKAYMKLLYAYHFKGPLILHGLYEREVPQSISYLKSQITAAML